MIEIKLLNQENEFGITLHVSKTLLMKKQVPVTPRWRDKRIVKENNFHTLFWTRVWKIQVALKSRLFWKFARTVLLKSRLTWNQGKILEFLKTKVVFYIGHEMCQSPLFITTAHPPNFKKGVYVMLCYFLDWQYVQPIKNK